MEQLDVYDETGNYLKTESRQIVHEQALWHNTVHCWLYDKQGNVYFQIRTDENRLYTTASGHVLAGEIIKQAFAREIKEEIGITLEYEKAQLIEIVKFKMDRKKSDGTIWKDRAFANIYAYLIEELPTIQCDETEVLGLAKVSAQDTLSLLNGRIETIPAQIYKNGNQTYQQKISIKEFLVNEGETAIQKYGNILEFILSQTEK